MSLSDQELRNQIHRAYPHHPETSDWEDVLARLAEGQAVDTSRRSWITNRFWMAAAIVACAAVAVVLLAVTSLWPNGPNIVGRAAAAIGAATPQQVLYERSTFESIGSKGLWIGPHGGLGRGSFQLWVAGGTGTRSFRSVTQTVIPHLIVRGGIEAPAAPWGNALMTLHPGRQTQEIGGILGPEHVVEAEVYEPQRREIVRYTQAPTGINAISFDPLAVIRQALSTGHAKSTGRTRVAGREVERIELTMRDIDNTSGTATYYVDARDETPVEVIFHHTRQIEYPYLPIFDPTVAGGIAYHFKAFRYLPSTAANLRLTNIQALHPYAKRVCGTEFGLPDC